MQAHFKVAACSAICCIKNDICGCNAIRDHTIGTYYSIIFAKLFLLKSLEQVVTGAAPVPLNYD
jgi:hypothetical protein